MRKKILPLITSMLVSALLLTALFLLLSDVPTKAATIVTDAIIASQDAGLELSPGYSQTVEPGTVVAYTHVLTNTGTTTDTFTLEASSSKSWPIALRAGGYSTGTEIGTVILPLQLDAGLTGTVVVSITVPTAAWGTIDYTVVTATSHISSSVWIAVIDTTFVRTRVYLPLVVRNYVANWSQGGLAGRTVYQIVVCTAEPDHLYAGTGEGVFRSTDGGASWQPAGLQGVLVRGLDVAPNACDQVYAATWGQHVQHSTDGGTSWSTLSNGLPEPYLYTVVVDTSSSISNRLYAGTASNGVYQSLDDGANWSLIFTAAGTIARLTLVAPDTLLVATWGSNAYQLTRSGEAWGATPLNVPSANVFEVIQGNGGVLFAATDNHLYRRTDSVWEEARGARAYGVAADPDQAQVVYAATADGAWRSTDSGENFTRLGLNGMTVRHIAPGPQGSTLLHAGTTDGAWRRSRPVSTAQSR